MKKLEGTLRADRQNPAAPKVEPARIPGPPKTLGEVERGHWRQLAKEVKSLGIYHQSNYSAFALLVKLRALVDSEDEAMPAHARAKLVQTCSGMLAQFGLTPASRARVSAVVAPEQSETERDLFDRPALRALKGGG